MNQGREPTLSAQPRAEHSGNMDVSPRLAGVERRQSNRHTETMSRSASRRPQMEGISTQKFVAPHSLNPSRGPQSTSVSNQGPGPTFPAQPRTERSGSVDVFPRPTGMERQQSSRHAETMTRSASRRPQMGGMYTQGFVTPLSR
jgi:hypothetical protein